MPSGRNKSSNIPLNVPRKYFWEYDYPRIDWKREAESIIQRVLERGNSRDYGELVKYYGKDRIVNSLKNEINSMPDEIIVDVCAYFKIDAKELRCYIRKQSRNTHWL
jgi:hypothetical protein